LKSAIKTLDEYMISNLVHANAKVGSSVPHLQWILWQNFKDVEWIYHHLRIMLHKQNLKNTGGEK